MLLRDKTIADFQGRYRNPATEQNVYTYANSIYIELGFKSPSELISALTKGEILYEIEMAPQKGAKRYCYCSRPDPTLYEIVNALWEKTYFCNLTAVYYHRLTNQIPQVAYVAREGIGRNSDLNRKKVLLSDAQIFQAFIKPHRYTSNIYKLKTGSIVLTERVDSDRLGIIRTGKDSKFLPPDSTVTSLERTLIDVCVNPQYNGGVMSVIEYFSEAKNRIDPETLIDIYKKLEFVYPYWQAIGFICDKAELKNAAEAIYRSFKIKNVFYLDHNAKTDWQLDEKWQIKHPRII